MEAETSRILLTRRGPQEVLARITTSVTFDTASDASPTHLHVPVEALPAFVAEHERQAPRWVWDDTTRWYPALLEAGVRVERCTDLRLCHQILRRSPGIDQRLLAGDDLAQWDALEPVTAGPPGLFDLHEHDGPLDSAGELTRQDAALSASPERRRLRLLLAAESAGALVAAEMTHAGLPWSAQVHDALLTEQLGPPPPAGQRPPVLARLLAGVREAFDAPDLNPDSPADLLRVLQAAGLEAADTRSATLTHLDHPGIGPLMEHRRLSRLHAANGWRWLAEWVHEGRYRPSYLPGGVVTGRWAAQGGGVLSVPVQLRPAVVADDGWRLVVADVAQLEPRVLAAISADDAMAQAARTTDLYQAMVTSGVVSTRRDAKVAVLGAMYGASSGEGGRMVEHLGRRYPRAIGFVEAAARAGEHGDVVSTWLGRASPLPRGAWAQQSPDQPGTPADDRERRAWGRFTRNYVVQGSGAEWALSWIALLRALLWDLGSGRLTERPHLVLYLHDEVVIHTPEHLVDAVVAAAHTAAERAGHLLFGAFPIDFPLEVSTGRAWAEPEGSQGPSLHRD